MKNNKTNTHDMNARTQEFEIDFPNFGCIYLNVNIDFEHDGNEYIPTEIKVESIDEDFDYEGRQLPSIESIQEHVNKNFWNLYESNAINLPE